MFAILMLILKELPKKCVVMLTYPFNATFHLKDVLDIWKVAEILLPTQRWLNQGVSHIDQLCCFP